MILRLLRPIYAQIFKATRIYVKNREFSIEEDSLFLLRQTVYTT